jgi:signal peptidase I
VLLSVLGAGLGHAFLGNFRAGFRWFVAVALTLSITVAGVAAGWRLLVWISFFLVVIVRIGAVVSSLKAPLPLPAPRIGRTALILAAMIALQELQSLASMRLIQAGRQPTPAMFPNLMEGDRFVTVKWWRGLEHGDIIVFDYPKDPTKLYVKRIVGLPGDTVDFRNGNLILNGSPVSVQVTDETCETGPKCGIWVESIGSRSYRIARTDRSSNLDSDPWSGPQIIPDGQVFVLGDNRENSADSRYWGTVPLELVRGKPRFVYWSSNEQGLHWDRINRVVE